MKINNSRSTIKRQVNLINELLNNYDFLCALCTYSHNDVDTCLENISKIINYYLHSNDFCIEYNPEILFKRINNFNITENNYLYYPSNSYFENFYKVFGLNYTHTHTPKYLTELEALETLISVNIYPYQNIYELFTDSKEAITNSLTFPSVLYQSILKVPYQNHQTTINNESIYYSLILERRLQNIPEDVRPSAAKTAQKWFNAFINNQPLLIILPKSKNDNEKNITHHISSRHLSFIKLPTRYTIQKICTKNSPPKEEEEEISSSKVKYYVQYSRYEELPISTDFIYTNEEFTGDIDYDIDLIYGSLDFNRNRRHITKFPYKDILKIKDTYDMLVKKINGKYFIKNGRHRLLYAKNFYVQNYELYRKNNNLDTLRKIVSLIVNVEHFIEDESINSILELLVHKYNAIFIKYDITNDNPEILIIINNKVYATKNISELEELYSTLESNQFINKYYISNNNEQESYNYNDIMSYIIITLQNKIYTMNFLDIIKFLLENGFYLDDKFYKPESLNYYQLYQCYTSLQKDIAITKYHQEPLNIVNKEMINFELIKIGRIIIDLIKSNPEYIELDWSKLVPILKQNPNLQAYDSDTLLKAANKYGYQVLKYHSIVKEKSNFSLKYDKI